MGGKQDRFDEYGQLTGGYDVAIAREKALEHARTELPERFSWLRGLKFDWEIESARFDEDEDCYKVSISCYPVDALVSDKAQFEYHIDATGKLYPGTPLLKSRGKWGERGVTKPGTSGDTIWWISLVLVFVIGLSALAVVLVDYNYDYIDIWWGGGEEASQSPGSETESDGEIAAASQCSLAVQESPAGRGTVYPDEGNYELGSSVKLTASPDSGWEFDHWVGDASGNSNPITITMDSDKSIVAYFEEIPPEQYSLSVSCSPSNGGYVSPSGGTYEEGSTVTLTAYPNSSYEFDHWGGSASGYSSSTSITMSSNKNVTAYFKTSTKDSDGDGLTDVEEAALGTNAFSWDTDGDGFNDPDDYCPTYDAAVKVEVLSFSETGGTTGDVAGNLGEPFAKVFIEGSEYSEGQKIDEAWEPFTAIANIQDNDRYVSISIEIWDSDGFWGGGNDQYDINGSDSLKKDYSLNFDVLGGTLNITSDGSKDGDLSGCQGKVSFRVSVTRN